MIEPAFGSGGFSPRSLAASKAAGNGVSGEVEKVAFEIRIHVQAYAIGYKTQSSSVTDVKPDETGDFQWIIDRLYEMGMR